MKTLGAVLAGTRPNPGRAAHGPNAATWLVAPGKPAVTEDEKVKTISIHTQNSTDQTSPAADPFDDDFAGGAAAVDTPATDAEAAPAAHSFAELGVLAETVEALDALGITTPFAIQSATIPVALAGSDVIGQAKTGTGKTLAFGIPVLQRVSGPGSDPATQESADAAAVSAGTAATPSAGSRRRRRTRSAAPSAGPAPAHGAPQALVVVPTRELAVQVTNDLLDAGKVRAIRVHALYGGRAYEPQVAALRAGIDIAVGTPGRLLDLARQNHLELGGVRTLVLDEADEMLDLGFLPDVERIIAQLPADRQTMLFSATMPGQVISLARRYMSRPTHIRAADPADEGAMVKAIAQFVYRAHSLDKVEMLARILQADGRGLTMIFARTKRTVAKIAEELSDRHFAVAAVHGDLGQGAREQALRAFRNGKIDVLVATDVAARGIDVEGVTHVINFQCPEDEKVYTHRIGRTGRAGAKGTAVTFVDWDEVPRWQLINKALDLNLAEPAETYSTSPQLYHDLGIPEGVKGILPRQERVRQGLGAEQIEDLGETGRGRGARGGRREGAEAPKRERAPRVPRQRARTRRGQTVERPADGQGGEVIESVTTEPGATSTTRGRVSGPTTGSAVRTVAEPAEAVSDSMAAEKKAPRKRSRTRKSAPAAVGGSMKLAPGSLAGPVEQTAEAQSAAIPEPIRELQEVQHPTSPDAEAPGARKRTRTRKSAAAKVEAETAAAAAEAAEVPAAEPRKRTRTRKGAAPADTAVAQAPADDSDELNAGPVANPRRTRVRATRNRKSAAAQPVIENQSPEQ